MSEKITTNRPESNEAKEKYREGWDRIFGDKKCAICGETSSDPCLEEESGELEEDI